MLLTRLNRLHTLLNREILCISLPNREILSSEIGSLQTPPSSKQSTMFAILWDAKALVDQLNG